MVTMTKTQWEAEAARLLVNNTTGDIEADEVRTLLTDLSDSITYLALPDPPEVRSFSIQNQVTTVDPDTLLSGSKTFLYNITNPADVTGNLTIDQAGANLSTTVNPNNTSVVLTINNITLTAGNSVVFTISGVDKDTNPFSKTFTVTARNLDDFVYFGTQVSSDPSGFDFANESRTPAITGSQSFTLPTWSGNEYLVIAQKASLTDLTGIIIDNINQLDAFTLTTNAFTVNSQNYDAYVSDNTIVGSIVSGESVTITR